MPEPEIALDALEPGRKQDALELLLEDRRSTRRFGAAAVTLADLAGLAWAAQGLTSDGRRVCPSAHALYPLSLTLVAGNVEGLPGGIYRYDPLRHRLQLIAAGDYRAPVASTSLADSDWLGEAAVLLVLSGDMDTATAHFADQPPHGRRGPRYVWLEAGCVAQNACLWAAGHGLGAALVGGFDDEALRDLDPVVLPRRYEPLALIGIGHPHPG